MFAYKADVIKNQKFDIGRTIAMIINTDRIPIITQAAEKVLREKFPDFEGTIDI